jgi:GNAT superfamily N-acetyltransferase
MTRANPASVSSCEQPEIRNGARAAPATHASVQWRHVEPGDGRDVAAIVKTAFGDDGSQSFRRCLSAASELAICCETGHTPIAACFGYPLPGCEQTAVLEGLAVVPEWRGRGIGSRTLEQFECVCRHLRYMSITLGASEALSVRFYLPRGYRAEASLAAADSHVVLEKHLGAPEAVRVPSVTNTPKLASAPASSI